MSECTPISHDTRGITNPDDYDNGKTPDVPIAELEKCGEEWAGFPERLEPPDPHADETSESKELDFNNFPSGDDPF